MYRNMVFLCWIVIATGAVPAVRAAESDRCLELARRFEITKPQITAIEVSLTLFSAVDANCIALATDVLDYGASVDARDRFGARQCARWCTELANDAGLMALALKQAQACGCRRMCRVKGQSLQPRLLAGSVLDNIAGFAAQGAEAGAARAAFLAGVHEMLAALPDGYETDVGEDGSALPVRVRRAVALARALHGNPRVVVLDEPELRLDEAGLGGLIRTLENLRRNGTSLVIATNEPRLLQLTDNIVLLSNGAVEAVLPSRQISGQVAGQVAGQEKRVA